MTGFLVFLVVLGFMVLIHEAGHFFAAKWAGVRVEAFAIGFGKRLFGVIHKGTDYRVNLLPLGGYVKMAGQDEMSSIEKSEAPPAEKTPDPFAAEPYGAGAERLLGGEHEREIEAETAQIAAHEGTGVEFTAVPRWKRIIIALAGPFANFALALVLLFFVHAFHHEQAEFLDNPPVLDYVPTNSAAARAGLHSGDTITSINGHKTPDLQTLMEQTSIALRNTVTIAYTENGAAKQSQIYLEPVSDERELTEKIGIVPQEQTEPIIVHKVQGDTPAARAGLAAGDKILSINGVAIHSVTALQALLADNGAHPVTLDAQRGAAHMQFTATPEIGAVSETRKQYRLGIELARPPAHITRLPFAAALQQSWKENLHSSSMLLQILHGLFTRQVSAKNMSGPIGIEQEISEVSKAGFWPVLSVAAFISINLGIFNLLPIPILDGGLIVFLLIESIARRDVKPIIKERVYQAAFVCILAFFCFVMWNDISRLLTSHHS